SSPARGPAREAQKRDGRGDRLRPLRLFRPLAARHAAHDPAQTDHGRSGAGTEREVAESGHPGRQGEGVPRPGGVISPLLSHLYRTEVDRMLERAKEVTRNGKYTYIEDARFADDRVI